MHFELPTSDYKLGPAIRLLEKQIKLNSLIFKMIRQYRDFPLISIWGHKIKHLGKDMVAIQIVIVYELIFNITWLKQADFAFLKKSKICFLKPGDC